MTKHSPRWEYQVVRLNIDPVEPQPTPAADATDQTDTREQPQKSQKPFSDSYLKEEFPNFYQPTEAEIRAAQIAAQQNDPAFQLQHFLNTQGHDGWELIGIDRAGPHEFVLFKRPVPGDSPESSDAHSDQLRLTLELATKCLSLMEKERQSSSS
jgi:hypothetical protein